MGRALVGQKKRRTTRLPRSESVHTVNTTRVYNSLRTPWPGLRPAGLLFCLWTPFPDLTPKGGKSGLTHCDRLIFSKESSMQFDKELDARGLNCPLPILRTKKTLTDMASGQVLKILATDPGAGKDFEAFSRQTGNELLSSETLDKEFVFFMKKK
jgi:tRNA 2-thiouridine synthesizing protein A